jgi:hypothetical protein
MAEARDLPAMM